MILHSVTRKPLTSKSSIPVFPLTYGNVTLSQRVRGLGEGFEVLAIVFVGLMIC